MPYVLKCWLSVDVDVESVYKTLTDVEQDCHQLEMMHPENKYEIIKCDEQGNEI